MRMGFEMRIKQVLAAIAAAGILSVIAIYVGSLLAGSASAAATTTPRVHCDNVVVNGVTYQCTTATPLATMPASTSTTNDVEGYQVFFIVSLLFIGAGLVASLVALSSGPSQKR
jgi:predicted nicotinamide N-methyase